MLEYASVESGYKRTQIAWKTKAFTILTSNETVIIPKIVTLTPRILFDDLYLQSNQYIKIRNLFKEKFLPKSPLNEHSAEHDIAGMTARMDTTFENTGIIS